MVTVEGSDEQMDVEQASSIPTPIVSAPDLEAPSLSTRVFKDECMLCFHSPFFEGGIYVCLQHFVGLCATHVKDYSQTNGCKYFLRIQKFKIKPKEQDEPKDKVQRLCILVDKEEEEEKNSLVVAPNFETDIAISEQCLDGHLFHVVQSVIRHASASYQNAIDAGVSDWDGSERRVLPNAEHLIQLDIDKQISYSSWKCEEPGCDLTENLWLNLSDGSILCGRAQYISEGKMSKGNSHAKIHAENSGFPVLVKLGTIHNGDADLYSYADNESVRDPYLKQHLAHFGLDINKFEKTEKSTLELELDLNQKWEWSRCQEDGVTLQNVYGSGFTGMINIGSSCYINSVLQTLLLDPVFVEAYTKQFKTDVSGHQLIELYEDFNFQLSRIVQSLVSGEYAKDGFDYNGIKPTQFRRVAGKGHSEFSTAGQQDAGEYITHLFNKMEETYTGEPNPVDNYRYKLVTCLKDNASQKVLYHNQPNFILSLLVPKDQLMHKTDDSVGDLPADIIGPVLKPRPTIDLTTLIEHYKSPQRIEDFVSPVTHENKGAEQSFRLGSFPKFLFIQVNRYEYDDFNQPRKLDLDVNVPDDLDLATIRFEGPRPDEELLPDSMDVSALLKTDKTAINQSFVQQIIDMGFPRRSAEVAVQQTQSTSAEEALEWLFAHMDDPILTQEPEPQTSAPAPPKIEKQYQDGSSHYKLKAFITHMGSSPHSGHYVCHLLRDGIWYLYNDEKVAVSQNPPKSLGYIYLYERQ